MAKKGKRGLRTKGEVKGIAKRIEKQTNQFAKSTGAVPGRLK